MTGPEAGRRAAGEPGLSGPRAARLFALVALLAVLAGTFTSLAGRRGLFPLDQSILFDGGHRVLSGQVPFRDFVAPVGPVAFWVQGGLFALFGVSWSGYLASAAVLAAAATAVAFGVVRTVVPGERWAPLLAAAGTGVWFLAPSGTPWIDATAFLLGLAALLALLRAATVPGRATATALGVVAGALAVATFLAKQTAGLAMLPALAVPFLLPRAALGAADRRRRLAPALLAGAAGAAGLFAAWLATAADPALFLRHVFEIPAGEGGRRLLERPARTLATLLTGVGPRPVRGSLLVLLVPAVAVLVRRPSPGGPGGPGGRGREAVLARLAVGLFLGQNLFLATGNNQPLIALPFAGLLLALGVRLAWGWTSDPGGFGGGSPPAPAGPGRRWRTGLVRAPVLAAATLLLASGVHAAWTRQVHEAVPAGARFRHGLAVPGLEALVWAEPTWLLEGGVAAAPGAGRPPLSVEAAHVEALVARLRRRGGPFFVFPDWTLLYGVVGRPAPQPLLWFHPGLTHPRGGDPGLDRWIVAELQRRGVATVVLEQASWFGTEDRLAAFPRLAAWLREGFEAGERIGPFLLLVARPGEPGSAPAARPREERPPAAAGAERGSPRWAEVGPAQDPRQPLTGR